MKKALAFVTFFLLTSISLVFAQTAEEPKDNKDNDQKALDESMTTPEQKKQMKAYEKKINKAKKEKEKKNKATRKQVEKKQASRLNKANAKTRKKKKRYVKTH